MGKRIYEPIKPGDKFGTMVVTGNVKFVMDKNRKRKYYEVLCFRCDSVKWIRDDLLRTYKSCGCMRKATRSKYLFCKSLKK